ncbi:MAG TPA: hypothetical protein VH914_15250 [Acidimicrobiia bacterium]|nr:hypothetical protein [Acidimicrobiia bacterium]
MTAPGEEAAASWGGARWRLRDLVRGERLVAAAVLALLLVPFAVALARGFADGIVPRGDAANVATRALDVFSHHPPLTGLPSTSQMYGDRISTDHPGPIEFYFLAAPLRVLGMTAGPLLTAAAINAACVLLAAWTVFRRLGSRAALWATVLLLAALWSTGTVILTDTVSSNMVLFPTLAAATLAWAVADGDVRLLPLTALVASYAAQQHLSGTLVVAALVAVALAAVVVDTTRRRRSGDADATVLLLRWSAAAAVVAAVAWVPVVIDELTGHPGNLTAIVRFARDGSRPAVGAGSAIDQVGRAIVPPTVFAHTDTTGIWFLGSIGPFRVAIAALIVVGLGVIAWWVRRESPALSRLALVALVALGAALLDGSNIPRGTEAWRVNLYHWVWAAVFLTWLALGIAIARVAGRVRVAAPNWLGPAALLVASAVIATAVGVVRGADDKAAQPAASALEARVARAVLDRVDESHPVAVVPTGVGATIAVAPYTVFRLVRAGVPVEVTSAQTQTYGTNRRYRAGTPVVLIVSGTGQLPRSPGTLLLRDDVSRERSALLDDLARTLTRGPVELAPDATAIVHRHYSGVTRQLVDALLPQLASSPRAALALPEVDRMLLAGVLRAPVVDRAQLHRLLAFPPDTDTEGGDEQVAVYLLDGQQARAAHIAG